MKRYTINPKLKGNNLFHGVEFSTESIDDENGDWVKFTDHQAEIAKRDELLIEARDYLLKNHFKDAQAVLIAGKIVEIIGLFAIAESG